MNLLSVLHLLCMSRHARVIASYTLCGVGPDNAGDHTVCSTVSKPKAHLHDGQERVEAVQVGTGGLDRHPNNWQRRESCDHARQVRCAARACDNHLRQPP